MSERCLKWPSKRIQGAVFALFALMLVVCGYQFYQGETRRLRNDRYRELAAIAEMKAGQITLWRQERLNDADKNVQSPLFRAAVEDCLANPNDLVLRSRLAERLKIERNICGYSDALLLHPDGRVLLGAGDESSPIGPVTMAAIVQVAESKRAMLSDLFRGPDGSVFIDAVAPVLDASGEFRALVLLRSDVRKFLCPLIQSWPIPSRSAETLLIRREQDSVVFLNNLRFRADAALSLRMPLDQRDLPAVQAVQGRRGRFDGTDYRGVEVLADLRPIPDSTWFMVAKVDNSDIMSGARQRAVATALFVLLLILLGAAVTGYGYRQRQARLYRDLYGAERKQRLAREEQRATLLSIGDGVIATNAEGCITLMNPVAEALTGWQNEEARGKPMAEVFRVVNAETKECCQDLIEKVLVTGKIVGLANHTVLISRNGAEHQIADSAAPIRDESGVVGVVLVFRDVTEAYRMQEALAASESRYRRLFEAAKDGILILDAETGVVVDVNPFLVELLGYSREQFLGKKVWEFGLSKDALANQEHLLRLKQQEYVRHEDLPFETADGRQIDVEFVSNVYLANDRKVIQCNIRDITKRKQAEEATKEEQALVQTMIDSTPGAFYMLDDAGCYFRWNAYQRDEIVGKPEEQMAGFPAIETIHPGDRDLVGSRIENILQGGSAEVLVGRVLLRGGPEYRYLLMTGRNVTIKGRPFLVGIGIDITDQKRAQEALRESEQRYRLLAENLTDVIWTMSIDGRFMYVSPSVAQLRGYTPEEVMQQTFEEAVCPGSRGTLLEQLHDVVENAKANRPYQRAGNFEIEQPCKDGTTVWTEATARLIPSEDGQTFVVLGISHDITERKREEKEKTALQERLAQAQKMESVGRLAGGVAHDFNNMLAVILGQTEMALDQVDPSLPLYADLKEIERAAQRSADLTRQLLAFARKQTVMPKVLDLNEIVDGMLKMLRRLIGEDIELAWRPGNDIDQIKIDPAQIDQILANLCVNARDAITGVGKITIETTNAALDEAFCASREGFVPGDYVVLAVSDNGCGMDKEIQSHIFEPFFTTKGVGEGTGLGLSTVYGIVKQNNGFINAYSEPGQGTTFRIYLPRYGASRTSQATLSEAFRKAPTGGQETILLVEDEPALLRLGETMLERLGYAVLTAGTPGEALRIAEERAGEIHLLITDVVMPEMNGRELARQLLALCPDLKCLFMSGYTANVIAHHGVLDEGVNFIQKPFSVKNLAAKVREALGGV